MTRSTLIAALASASLALSATSVHADPIRYWSRDAELTISQVSPHTVRVHLAPLDDKGKPFPGILSTVLVDHPNEVKLRVREITGLKQLTIGDLAVAIKLNPLTVAVSDSKGKVVQELIVADADGSMEFRTPAPVLGLGEGDKQFDRRGSVYRSQLVNGQVAPLLNTHGATIRIPFIIGTDGWALFVHRPFAEFDLRNGKGKVVPIKSAKGSEPLDVFVINSPEPATALSEYIRITGRPVMPPKWVTGYVQSHRTLAGPQEPVEVVNKFRDKKLPLDTVIYLGTGYCPAGWNVDNGTLDFNPKTFDNPPQNIKALHDVNVRVILHVNKAPKGMFGLSIKDQSKEKNHISNYWNWHLPVFKLGIDGWWPDDGDELPVEARMARHRCYFEGPLQVRPNERPWSLHRNGYAGTQRYGGWIWTGDPQSKWETLKHHVPVGINTCLSLTPFWSSDTGGFVTTKEYTGDLYVRWFQLSTFSALMRSHGRNWKLHTPWGWNTGDYGFIESPITSLPDKSELNNAEVEPICKKYLELRYQLLPYNYTLLRETHDTGMPPMRALWLHYPSDPEAVKLGEEYLWGRDLLVAPVVEKGAKERSLYLPQGDWYDWWTGEKQSGKRWIKRSVDLSTMPIYARAGAIIPLDPIRQYTDQPVSEPTTLRVYPGADGQYVLYDDDGKTLEYLKNKATWIKISWNDASRTLVIEPDTRNDLQQPQRVFNIVLANAAKGQSVTYAGKRVEVRL